MIPEIRQVTPHIFCRRHVDVVVLGWGNNLPAFRDARPATLAVKLILAFSIVFCTRGLFVPTHHAGRCLVKSVYVSLVACQFGCHA